MKKPKILVTSRDQNNGQPILQVNKNYIDALNMCNAVCFMYTYGNTECMDEIARDFDGLLITGGQDIDSKYYNEPLDATDCPAADYIDEADLALIRAFHNAKKPILGICRGLQVINVAFGGSLYHDLNSSGLALKENHHNQGKRNLQRQDEGHCVFFDEGNIFCAIFGNEVPVNSYHHQAIKQLADNLTVCGRSDDGIIEAISGERIIAVQWHPEWLIASQPCQLKIFEEFIKQVNQ